mgnify:FL=1
MNIVTGSSGGLGKSVYNLFVKNSLPVIGIDINKSETCDLILDLSKNNFEDLTNTLGETKIDSITFCHAIGNSVEEINKYSLDDYLKINALSSLDLYNFLKKNLSKNSSLSLISSIHAISTNKQSSSYALSKVLLESIFKMMCLDETTPKLNLIRLGAVDTSMLHKNISNIDSLRDSIPSKEILEPDEVAGLIYDIHTKHSSLLNKAILQIDGGALFKLSTD